MTKTVLVTGGTKGIGAALVQTQARQGHDVIFTGRSEAAGKSLESALSTEGWNATFCAQDVSSSSDWVRVSELIQKRGGALHALVNNAGIHTMKTLSQYSESDFDMLTNVNLRGVFLGTQACLPFLAGAGTVETPSSIVNVSSVAGLVGGVGQSLYNMTKGGLELFSKSIALEVAALGFHIKVNSVCPGIVETDMGENLILQFEETGLAKSADHAQRMLKRGYAHGEFPTVEDVVSTISFLIDGRAAFLTGASIPVDRGYTAG